MSGYVTIATRRGAFEPLRSLAYGSVLDAYSAIGAGLDYRTRVFVINNFTDIDIKISFDSIVDHLAIPAGGNIIIDSATNGLSLPKGTVFYVKRYTAGGAASSGHVDVSIGYTLSF